jgi:hypothetical protein
MRADRDEGGGTFSNVWDDHGQFGAPCQRDTNHPNCCLAIPTG